MLFMSPHCPLTAECETLPEPCFLHCTRTHMVYRNALLRVMLSLVSPWCDLDDMVLRIHPDDRLESTRSVERQITHGGRFAAVTRYWDGYGWVWTRREGIICGPGSCAGCRPVLVRVSLVPAPPVPA